MIDYPSFSIDPNTPVIIGGGQFTQRKPQPEQFLSPAAIMAKAGILALQDAGISADSIETVACVRIAADTTALGEPKKLFYANLPAVVAQQLNIRHAKEYILNEGGGSSPPSLIAKIAKKISAGEIDTALVIGGEALDNTVKKSMMMLKDGIDLASQPIFDDQLNEANQEPLSMVGEAKAGVNTMEYQHGLALPINAYPLIANGLRAHYGQTASEHIKACAQLGERFSSVAAKHPEAWFQVQRSAQEIQQVNDANRWIGFPYPKLLNSIMRVNMSAGVILSSWKKAQELGVDPKQCVFLHGATAVDEIWNISQRENYHSSRAIKLNIEASLAASGNHGLTIKDMDILDLYSCFPCAVQIACDELGIAHDDARGLTVTGGLPYFGGAGNNYSMNAIVTMLDQLRARPKAYGLSTGNGWYLTKHSSVILSCQPYQGHWQPVNTVNMQKEINSYAQPCESTPTGQGTVETYTVCHDKDGPKNTIVIGRLDSNQQRFVALAGLNDRSMNQAIQDREFLGAKGQLSSYEVKPGKTVNIFTAQ